MSYLSEIRKHLLTAAFFLAAMATLPYFISERYLLGQIIVFMLWASVATQWNVLTGHAGVFSLGQMLFFAVGSYTVGMAGTYLGASPWISMPVGAVLSAIAALLIGIACLRLASAYVALLTFAIVFMVQTLIVTDPNCFTNNGGVCLPLFGGGNGFSGFADFGFRKILKGDWIVGNYFVILASLALSLVASIVVIHGRLGLAFRALNDSQLYAASRGLNRTRFRVTAFVITAFFTGLSGAVYAAHFRFAGPSLFEMPTLVLILAMVIVGGLRSTWGPVLGAAAMMVLVEIAKGMGDVRNTAVGVVLVLFVLLFPKGIAGAATAFFAAARKLWLTGDTQNADRRSSALLESRQDNVGAAKDNFGIRKTGGEILPQASQGAN